MCAKVELNAKLTKTKKDLKVIVAKEVNRLGRISSLCSYHKWKLSEITEDPRFNISNPFQPTSRTEKYMYIEKGFYHVFPNTKKAFGSLKKSLMEPDSWNHNKKNLIILEATIPVDSFIIKEAIVDSMAKDLDGLKCILTNKLRLDKIIWQGS
jgi:hypothetical protein